MKPNQLSEGLSRRSFLGVAGIVSSGVGIHRVGQRLHTESRAFDVLLLEAEMRGLVPGARGVAREVDTNKDGETEVDVERADTDDRDDVLHVTSNETATPDYGFSIANVQPRKLTLGDLTEDTTYDYMEGDTNTAAAPDEVWIVLRSKETDTKGRQYVCRTETDDSASSWKTRDVHREITGHFGGTPQPGSGQPWKEFDRSEESLTEVGDDLIANYGEEATVQGIGVGHGTPTTSATQLDMYYDSLVVAGESTDLPD